ncbi:hypothetical protein [Bradyrhizobium sp. Ec3.3]|uniref:hypothetical protein n=1 Tax=Bradyrhizobium sp. Ec3.3 TaxID=189753 RepID=UPI0003FCB1C5|nr:hypothetical protein [Bradyrhizobium sp. Ec3.3]
MSTVDPTWYTGEHGQQLQHAEDHSLRRRPGKLPPSTQAAIDDINRRYPTDLNDELPEL